MSHASECGTNQSSEVAQEAAADMSITLTGLAGDLASFYNLDTDEAFRKLRAAIAGETEPMKALGVLRKFCHQLIDPFDCRQDCGN